jgi:hypothetical protein
MKKKIYTKLFNIRLPDGLIDEYKRYCNNNCYALSKRLRFLIEMDIKNKIIIRDDTIRKNNEEK